MMRKAVSRKLASRSSLFAILACAALLIWAGPVRGEVGLPGDLYIHQDAGSDLGHASGRVAVYDGSTGGLAGIFAGVDWPPMRGVGGVVGVDDRRVAIAFGGPNDNVFVLAKDMHLLLAYDGRTGEPIRAYPFWNPSAMAFAADGNLLVAADTGGGHDPENPVWGIMELDPGSGQVLGVFAYQMADKMAFGPNGNLFILDSAAGIVELDGGSGAFVGVFVDAATLAGRQVWALRFHPTTGHLLAAVRDAGDGGVAQFDGTTGQELAYFVPPGDQGMDITSDLAFGPNGNLFVVANPNFNGKIFEYDAATGAFLGIYVDPPGTFDRPLAIDFKPDLGPFPAPTLSGFAPPAAENCGWLTGIAVSGSGLATGAVLTLERSGETPITLHLTDYADGFSVPAKAYLGGAAAGTWDLMLTYPDGQSTVLASAMTITGCSDLTVAGVSITGADNCGPIYGAVVTGSGLVEGTTFKLARPGEPDIAGIVIEHPAQCCGDLSTVERVVDFPLSGVALGYWDLTATNHWGQSDTLPGALTVTGCAKEYIFYDLIGRPGSAQEFVFDTRGAQARDVNDAGTVCGWMDGHAVTWSDGVVTQLDADWDEYEGADFREGHAISETGIVVGRGQVPGLSGVSRRMAYYPDGTIQILSEAAGCGAGGGFLFAVSPDGSLAVGVADCGGTAWETATLWSLPAGTAVIPDPPVGLAPDYLSRAYGVTDAGAAVISYYWWNGSFTERHGFIRHADATFTEILNPLGWWNVKPYGMSNNGSFVAGSAGDPFRYDVESATFCFLPATGAIKRAMAVNDHGVAVGYQQPPVGRGDALLWPKCDQKVNLQELYLPAEWEEESQAHGINNRGWIVGYGVVPRGFGWTGWSGRLDYTYYPWLLVPNVNGDIDRDLDVDLDDHAGFTDCMAGADVVPTPSLPLTAHDCTVAFDFDRDNDVDLDGYAEFQRRFGTDQAGVGACCLTDGSCVEMRQPDCTGFYQGTGTLCGQTPCPALGACCDGDAGGTCQNLTESQCLALGDTYQGDATTCGLIDCPFGQYSNEIDPMTSMALAGAGLQIADDMTLEGTGARDLVFLDLRVYGNGGGDFDVTVSLYTDCPGNGGTPIPPLVDLTWPGIPDDGYVYIVEFSGPPVTIPDTVWMVATFSTPESGWIIAEQAETGTTADVYGWNNPWTCNQTFGANYAGLWANLRCVEGQSRASGDGQETRLSITKVETDAAPVPIEPAE